MNSNHPAFVTGFVKQCFNMGLTEDSTVAAYQMLEKRATGLGLLEKLKNLGGDAVTAWNGANPETKGALIGAGVGGAGGLVLGGKNRIRNALLGALAGGGLGYGAGHYLKGGPKPDQLEGASEQADLKQKLQAGGNPFKKEDAKENIAANIITGKPQFTSPGSMAPGKPEMPALPTDTANIGVKPKLNIGAVRQMAADASNPLSLRETAMSHLNKSVGGIDDVSRIGAALSGAGEGIAGAAKLPVDAAIAAGRGIKETGKGIASAVESGVKSLDRTLREKELQKALQGAAK